MKNNIQRQLTMKDYNKINLEKKTPVVDKKADYVPSLDIWYSILETQKKMLKEIKRQNDMMEKKQKDQKRSLEVVLKVVLALGMLISSLTNIATNAPFIDVLESLQSPYISSIQK